MTATRKIVFGFAMWAVAAASFAQTLGAPVITIAPNLPTNADSVVISVPVPACLSSQPLAHVDSSSWEISGHTIFIATEQWGLICFSAGDPEVYKPYSIQVGRLSAGSYSIVYYHTWTGQSATQQLSRFEVLSPIPTLSLSLLMIVAVTLAMVALVQLRSRSNPTLNRTRAQRSFLYRAFTRARRLALR